MPRQDTASSTVLTGTHLHESRTGTEGFDGPPAKAGNDGYTSLLPTAPVACHLLPCNAASGAGRLQKGESSNQHTAGRRADTPSQQEVSPERRRTPASAASPPLCSEPASAVARRAASQALQLHTERRAVRARRAPLYVSTPPYGGYYAESKKLGN
jgi:hypothetical protein